MTDIVSSAILSTSAKDLGADRAVPFVGLSPAAARAFAEAWLPAWSGNRPEVLLAFYTPDIFYLDPAVPEGLRGHAALRAYFVKLLARFPDWIWTQREAVPMAGGFVNLWRAEIPLPARPMPLIVDGVCLVWLNEDGLIARNEVYFDRSALLAAMTVRG